jgi:hypothetical protein
MKGALTKLLEGLREKAADIAYNTTGNAEQGLLARRLHGEIMAIELDVAVDRFVAEHAGWRFVGKSPLLNYHCGQPFDPDMHQMWPGK